MAAANAGRVDPVEKRVLWGATLFTLLSIALIGYAAFGLGATVPTCNAHDSHLFHQGEVIDHGGKRYEIHYLARMWKFEPSRVQVPVGSTLDISVTSKDVTHGFQIIGTNVNLMAVPGVVTSGQVVMSKPGLYQIVCHEYCGAAHQNMTSYIEVSEAASGATMEGTASAAAGKAVFEAKGCSACHSTDGSPGVGPSLKGMWGASAHLVSGAT